MHLRPGAGSNHSWLRTNHFHLVSFIVDVSKFICCGIPQGCSWALQCFPWHSLSVTKGGWGIVRESLLLGVLCQGFPTTISVTVTIGLVSTCTSLYDFISPSRLLSFFYLPFYSPLFLPIRFFFISLYSPSVVQNKRRKELNWLHIL